MNVFSSNVQKQQPMASVDQPQQQASLSQITDFSDPISIISRVALLLTAGNYGTRKVRCTGVLKKAE